MQVFKKIWTYKSNKPTGSYHTQNKNKKTFYSLQKHMTKTVKIILAILVAMIIWLIWYAIASQSKINAQQEIIDKQQPIVDTASRIAELDRLIEIAQSDYEDAFNKKIKCESERNTKMDDAHKKADEYRNEQSELMGFLMSR